MAFIPNTEATPQEKWSEIWRHVHSLADVAGLPQSSCLDLALKILNQLPTIPLDLSYCTPIPMMITYAPESYANETWHEDCQGTSPLEEEAKASHLLTMKLTWMVDREEPEEHTHARPPLPSPSVGSAVPGTPERPPSRSPSLSRSTNKPCHRSLSQLSSSSSDSSEPPQKPSHTDSESESEDDNETDSEAGIDTSSDSGDKNEAQPVGTLSTGTQRASLTARLGSLVASLKGQVAVQVAVQVAALTALALNQMRRRNLHQWAKCPQMLTQTLLRLACCQRSKALTQGGMEDELSSLWAPHG